MEDGDVIKKIQEIYNNFIYKMNTLTNKRKDLFKTYRQKLEEAKIKEIKDSILK